MVELIIGDKGKGKTVELLAKVNQEIKETIGNIVYLDKSNKHMYELNNKIRLINVRDFSISNIDEFIGLILGIISQDNDLKSMYCDNFLKLASVDENNRDINLIENTVNRLNSISEKFDINFTITLSLNDAQLTDDIRKFVVKTL